MSAPCGGCGNCQDCLDGPSVGVIEQEEHHLDALHPVVVTIDGPVRTEELPSRNGGAGNRILRAGAAAERLVNEDPRRKRLILWANGLGTGADGVCLAPTRGEADQFTGAILFATAVPVRYELGSDSAWWMRPFLLTAPAGIFGSYGASTADLAVSWFIENWAR